MNESVHPVFPLRSAVVPLIGKNKTMTVSARPTPQDETAAAPVPGIVIGVV